MGSIRRLWRALLVTGAMVCLAMLYGPTDRVWVV
jgi:hypothetical protein